MLTIELHAREVANEVLGTKYEAVEKDLSGDFIDIVTIIMQALMEALQNCPQSNDLKKQGIKRPSISQRVGLLGAIKTNYNSCCGDLHELRVNRIYRGMLDKAKSLTDEQADQIIHESSDTKYLFI